MCNHGAETGPLRSSAERWNVAGPQAQADAGGGYVSLGAVDSDALYEPPSHGGRAQEQQPQENVLKPAAEASSEARPP